MHANTKHLHGNTHDTKVIMKKPSYYEMYECLIYYFFTVLYS